MDKGTFILALGFTVVVGLYALNMTRSDIGARQNSDDYAMIRQARQIALTGINLAVNKLRSNSSWTAGFQNEPVLQGKLDLTVDMIGLLPDQRRVTSVGKYFGHVYRMVSILQVSQQDRDFNQSLLNVQSAMEMQGISLSIQPGNLFYINGNDWVSDTTFNQATAKYGIGASTNPQLTVEAVRTALTNANATQKVVGIGNAPSIVSVSPVNMNQLADEVRRVSTIIHTKQKLERPRSWGTMNNPEIVYATKTLTVEKPLNGAGILFIKGNIRVNSTINWDGYLIVGGNEIRVNPSGNVVVRGAVYFGNGQSLKFGSTGNMNVVYSSNVLNVVKANLFGQSNSRLRVVRTFEEKIAPNL